jgi:hypothetical protein
MAHDMTHGVPHGDSHGGHYSGGFVRWLETTNHKDIGIMYLIFGFVMLFIGGAMILAVRAELFQPGLQLMQPEFFNQLITLARTDHGVWICHAGGHRSGELHVAHGDWVRLTWPCRA